MEEKKQRGLFYSKGLKIAFIVYFFCAWEYFPLQDFCWQGF